MFGVRRTFRFPFAARIPYRRPDLPPVGGRAACIALHHSGGVAVRVVANGTPHLAMSGCAWRESVRRVAPAPPTGDEVEAGDMGSRGLAPSALPAESGDTIRAGMLI